MTMTVKKNHITIAITGLILLVIAFMTIYTVQEGHVGVVKRFSKAIKQVGPGLHTMIPFVDSVEHIEVRQRKNSEQLSAATQNQLPVTADVSINWTVNQSAAMELFIKYGGIEQFEERILDPKLRSAAKAAIAQFPADELIRNRNAAVSAIMEEMTVALEEFPVTINSPQIENLALPETYMASVQAKESAREDAQREKHKLEQQELIARQAVNSAKANAEAKRLVADAEAYRINTEATAEANAIQLITEQLAESPLYIELAKTKRWDGALPTTMLGERADPLLSIPLLPRVKSPNESTQSN